jgi:hypothetical protein
MFKRESPGRMREAEGVCVYLPREAEEVYTKEGVLR